MGVRPYKNLRYGLGGGWIHNYNISEICGPDSPALKLTDKETAEVLSINSKKKERKKKKQALIACLKRCAFLFVLKSTVFKLNST